MDKELLEKYDRLKEYLISLGNVGVAFSSGVDSTFLLYAAKDALNDKMMAITATACFVPESELDEAKQYCLDLGIKHLIVSLDIDDIDGFAENPKNRCYVCKKQLFGKMIEVAKENGATAIVEGSNLDDDGDYRPGLKAISELGVYSPLRHIGFTKKDIRLLSEYLYIPTWNKPSYACLASRIPYGEVITREKLKQIELSEKLLMEMGFKQMRVRCHGNVARIELDPSDFERFMNIDIRNTVYDKLKEYGFAYVSLDLLGYRTGSLNETIL